MPVHATWTKDVFEKSVSSRCWWYTPYDLGTARWEKCAALRDDAELQTCVMMECQLGEVPEWAVKVVERAINNVAPCGHHTFPLPYLELLDSIGEQRAPTIVHSCFWVTRERKRALQDYVLCLDAWLAGAAHNAVAKELNALAARRINWTVVCQEMWRVLGEGTEVKQLLVERLILGLRSFIKETVSEDDPGTAFGRDQYLGDYAPTACLPTQCPDTSHKRAAFDLAASPKVRRIDERLEQICPHMKFFRSMMLDNAWLCGPKAFRYIERLLWAIGTQRPFRLGSHPEYPPAVVPGFLGVEDTYPDLDEAARWWGEFRAALGGYVAGRSKSGAVAEEVERRLDNPTPVKRWLVRLYKHKLRLLEDHAQLEGLVRPSPNAKRGTQPLTMNG